MKINKFNLKKLKRLNINKLFYNNKIVLFLSIIISFLLWTKLSTSNTETITKQITGIPITVNLSDNARDNNLTVFGLNDVTAEVTVSGNRIVLGQLNKDAIQVFAQQSAGIINTTGNYTLELAARKTGVLTGFEFVSSVSPRFVNVFVDRLSEKTFDIIPEITYHADPTYFSIPVALSDSTVTISGPESVVSNISKVVVEGKIDGTLRKTTTLNNLPILLYDNSGKKINNANLTCNISKVDATISVLNKKTINVLPTFENQPTIMPFGGRVKVSPSTVEIAATDEILTNINKIETEAIDFSKINLDKNEFSVSLKIPNGCRNLSNTYLANVKINMTGMQSKKINVDKFTFINLAENKKASALTVSFKVDVIGPASEIKNLNSSNVYAQIDLSEKESFTGTTDLPAKIIIDSKSKCWIYGSYNITAKIQ